MKEKNYIFGVDLDGVCADFISGLHKIAADWLNKPAEKLTKEVSDGFSEWELDPVGGYDDLHRFAITQRGLFRELKPIKGACVSLRRLSEKGVRIRIITHRLFIKYFHQEAIRQTTEWLDYMVYPIGIYVS